MWQRDAGLIIGGQLLAVIVGFSVGVRGRQDPSDVDAHRGVWRGLRTAFAVAGIAGLCGVLVGVAAGSVMREGMVGGMALGVVALGIALGLGWARGGGASLKHGILRLLLWRRGAIPWNYAAFLDFAAEQVFVRKVGGGYIFIHRLLQEHLARAAAGNEQRNTADATTRL